MAYTEHESGLDAGARVINWEQSVDLNGVLFSFATFDGVMKREEFVNAPSNQNKYLLTRNHYLRELNHEFGSLFFAYNINANEGVRTFALTNEASSVADLFGLDNKNVLEIPYDELFSTTGITFAHNRMHTITSQNTHELFYFTFLTCRNHDLKACVATQSQYETCEYNVNSLQCDTLFSNDMNTKQMYFVPNKQHLCSKLRIAFQIATQSKSEQQLLTNNSSLNAIILIVCLSLLLLLLLFCFRRVINLNIKSHVMYRGNYTAIPELCDDNTEVVV